MLKFVKNFLLNTQQHVVTGLHVSRRLNKQSAHNIRTVRLVTCAQHTHDGTKMKLVVVAKITVTYTITPNCSS